MLLPALALALTLAYVLGSIPSGLIVGHARGVDIRRHGSGNAGATNAWRVLGKGPGLLVFALDFLKGAVAVLIAYALASWLLPDGSENTKAWVMMAAGAAAMLGHVYTVTGRLFFGSWRGGKGVATGGGVLLGLMPPAMLAALAVLIVTVVTTRYVSLGSILAAVTIAVVQVLRSAFLHHGPPGPLVGFSVVIPFFIVYTHRANLRRLLAGTETRFSTPARPAHEENG
jgi:glycerol-3-phosphate acyltransferase PlsY